MCNMQSREQRMSYEDREEMIAKRMHRHMKKWQKYRRHEYREKMRKKFREMLQKQRTAMRKAMQEQREKQREYIRQLMFNRMAQNSGLFSPYKRYAGGITQTNKVMGNSFGFGSVLGHHQKKRRLVAHEFVSERYDISDEHGFESESESESESTSEADLEWDIEPRFDLSDWNGNDSDDDLDRLSGGVVDAPFASSDWDGSAGMTDDEWDMLYMDPLRCIMVENNGEVYEICINLQTLSIKKMSDSMHHNQEIGMWNVTSDGSIAAFEQYKYRQTFVRSDNQRKEGGLSMEIVDYAQNAQFVAMEVIEYEGDANETRQYFEVGDGEGALEMYMEYDDEKNTMILNAGSPLGAQSQREFNEDDHWTEINRIESKSNEEQANNVQLSKCIFGNKAKMCVIEQCTEGQDVCVYNVVVSRVKV